MKNLNLKQLDLFATFPQFNEPQGTLFQLVDDKATRKTPRKQTANIAKRPKNVVEDNSLPLFAGNVKKFTSANNEPATTPQLASEKPAEPLYPHGSKSYEKLTAESKETIETAQVKKGQLLEKCKELTYEQKQKEQQVNPPYKKGSWEEARAKNERKIQLFNVPTQELEEMELKLRAEIPTHLLRMNDEFNAIFGEINRRCELVNLQNENGGGLKRTGSDFVATIPHFFLKIISVAKSARKDKYCGNSKQRKPNGKERFFIADELYKSEKEINGCKDIKRITYTGFEISIEEMLVFLALIKNAIDKQYTGINPWGILTIKKSDIIKYVGWQSHKKKKGGKYYQKLENCLRVLNDGSWTVEWGKDLFGGHFIEGFYKTKEAIEWKTGQAIPDDLPELRNGEIYYKLSPFLLPFFRRNFSLVNVTSIKQFLYDGKRTDDLKAWFYLYLMSLYYETKEKQIPPTPHKPGRVEKYDVFQETICLEKVIKTCNFQGDKKKLKYILKNSILPSMVEHFSKLGGELEYEFEKTYTIRLKKFKKPSVYMLIEQVASNIAEQPFNTDFAESRLESTVVD